MTTRFDKLAGPTLDPAIDAELAILASIETRYTDRAISPTVQVHSALRAY
jgi:hypothetical protein